jgi:hypothetical protein
MAFPDHEYDAFISYRHVSADRGWAIWLHRSLERFRTPRALVRKGVPRRLTRIFRDEDELAASADLGEDIRRALRNSRFLIVVCSPRTPSSKWIAEEIREFSARHGYERILTFLIEGEPQDAFPNIPAREATADALAVEPLAADIRPVADESSRRRRRLARLRILAPLLACRFDDLRQREQERSLRWLTGLVAALVVVGAAIAAAALAFLAQRDSARDLPRASRSEGAARGLEHWIAAGPSAEPRISGRLHLPAGRTGWALARRGIRSLRAARPRNASHSSAVSRASRGDQRHRSPASSRPRPDGRPER